jgi:glycosyltransferase involved in cell wall biosynthesis
LFPMAQRFKKNVRMEAGLVSVIVPAFNADRYIGDAIKSALHQTYNKLEIIVVDDGSVDRTVEVVKSFTDSRVRVLTKRHSGLVDSLNYGISNLRGEYCARLDADDCYAPNHIEQAVKILREQKNVSAVLSLWRPMNELGQEIVYHSEKTPWVYSYPAKSLHQLVSTLPVRMCLTGPAIVGHSTVFKEFPFWKGATHMEDYHLALTLISGRRVLAFTPTPSYFYRVRNDSISRRVDYKKLEWRYARVKLDALFRGGGHCRWDKFHSRLLTQSLKHIVRAGLYRFQK